MAFEELITIEKIFKIIKSKDHSLTNHELREILDILSDIFFEHGYVDTLAMANVLYVNGAKRKELK